MANAKCLENIKKKTPPDYCGEKHCSFIQEDINEYCDHLKFSGWTPVPQNVNGKKCWCCCSCLAWGTPVEVEKGVYAPIENISSGDYVLATGLSVSSWERRKVTSVGGIAPGSVMPFCRTVRIKFSDGASRQVVSTADHLYLSAENKLIGAKDLRPGDLLMQADGCVATVEFSVVGEFSGGIRHVSLGDLSSGTGEPGELDGHLLNTAGVISADLAVQVAYWGGELEAAVEDRKNLAPVGSPGFFEAYETRAYAEFLSSPGVWPSHFKPLSPPIFSIPPGAHAYLTADQAQLLAAGRGFDDEDNAVALANFTHVAALFRAFHPGILVLADWASGDVNAWYFESVKQRFIIVTGALLRSEGLSVYGLSVVLSHHVAVANGHRCVGDADYWGIGKYFREVWYDEGFFEAFERAYSEIEGLFRESGASDEEKRVTDPCNEPSLACRLECLKNAGGFLGVAECAVPASRSPQSSAA